MWCVQKVEKELNYDMLWEYKTHVASREMPPALATSDFNGIK